MNKLLASAALVACFGAAAPLSAAVVQVQYTGTVSEGFDTTGIFGTAGSFLNGAAYTANYTFETTYGTTHSSLGLTEVYGGGLWGTISPSLGATITINGITVSLVGNLIGHLVGYNNGTLSQVLHEAEDFADTGSGYSQTQLYNVIDNDSNAFTNSLTDPLSYAVAAGDDAYGYFAVSDIAYDFGSASTNAYAQLVPDHITIGAPIPEPETYAMLLAGLGLLGFAARRRKLKEAAAESG